MESVRTVGYDVAIKKKDVLIHTTTQVDFETLCK